jgi:hypothetical protein
VDVLARPAPGVVVDLDSFADLTSVVVKGVSWDPDGWLRVRFDGDLTHDEVARVRRRMSSATVAEEDLRAACETWANGSDKTTAGIAAQVRRLTRLALMRES